MKIKIGNAEFVDSKEKIDEKGTILYLKIEDEITGGIVLTDEIKSDAKETIKQLKELVIKANDSIPANSVIEYDGDVVPEGYEKAEDEDWENLNEDYGCYYKMIGKQVFIRAV